MGREMVIHKCFSPIWCLTMCVTSVKMFKIHTKINFKICFIKLNSLVVNALRVLRNMRHGPWMRWKKKRGEVMPGDGLIKIVYFTDAVYPTCFHYIHYLCFSPKPKSRISSRREERKSIFSDLSHISGSKFQDERR